MSKMVDVSKLYLGFCQAAREEGFQRAAPESRTLRDLVTITVASDVGAASNPLKKSFFQTTSQPNRVRRSQEPKILDGAGVSKDVMLGFYGVSVFFDHVGYAGTLTETNEVLAALADAVLELRIGSDVLCELTGADVLRGPAGFNVGTDTATATALVRNGLQKTEPHCFEWARIATEGAQLGADLFIDKTSWTTNNNIDLKIELHAWVARFGQPTQGSARVAPRGY
jgi:hypothetical protein